MIIDKLINVCKEKSFICVGLDFNYEYLPEYLSKKEISIDEKIFEFNKKIIDDTKDLVGCYKLQIACYEAYGIEGLIAYKNTVKYLKENDLITIGDVKRGDILSTAKMYAKAHFENDFEVDFMTINPYMGEDSISPYYEYIKNKQKGIFVLLKTSNESSKDFQDIKIGEEVLYEKVGQKIDSWSKEFIGESNYSSVGAVLGLTNEDDFKKLKKLKNTFFLVPGYGAQGGGLQQLKEFYSNGLLGVVNSSRGIIKAHKNICEDENFSKESRKAVLKMKEDLDKCLS
ncbi:orotidine-5'-phosphate decarboxylase [Peptostreptococcaceae bacterium AGR-M142]